MLKQWTISATSIVYGRISLWLDKAGDLRYSRPYTFLDADGNPVRESQGIREWTKGNQLRYYLKSIMAGAYKNGEKPPAINQVNRIMATNQLLRANQIRRPLVIPVRNVLNNLWRLGTVK